MHISGKKFVLALMASVALAGCGGGDESTPSGGSNAPPIIAGSPPTALAAGNAYSFTPTAADPDGDTLTFSATNVPAWATFNKTTGALTGSPAEANVGMSEMITIEVSDSKAIAQLPAFRIQVSSQATAPPPTNVAPTLSGSAALTATVGQVYTFQPVGDQHHISPAGARPVEIEEIAVLQFEPLALVADAGHAAAEHRVNRVDMAVAQEPGRAISRRGYRHAELLSGGTRRVNGRESRGERFIGNKKKPGDRPGFFHTNTPHKRHVTRHQSIPNWGRRQSPELVTAGQKSQHSPYWLSCNRIRRYSICPRSPSNPIGPVAGTLSAASRTSPLQVQ